MKQLPLFLCLFILVAIISCKKGNNYKEIIYNYHGYIYKKYDSTPYSNTSFICYQGKAREFINDPKETIIPFTTDDSGYFSIDIPVFNNASGTMVCWPDMYSSYDGCPANNSYFPEAEHNKLEYDAGIIYLP